MVTKIELPAPFRGYAIVRDGQDAIEAVGRSIARRIGNGAFLYCHRETSRSVNRNDEVLWRNYQLTFVYPKSRRGGGFPFAREVRISI